MEKLGEETTQWSFWEPGSFDLRLPYAGDTKETCAIFRKIL